VVPQSEAGWGLIATSQFWPTKIEELLISGSARMEISAHTDLYLPHYHHHRHGFISLKTA